MAVVVVVVVGGSIRDITVIVLKLSCSGGLDNGL